MVWQHGKVLAYTLMLAALTGCQSWTGESGNRVAMSMPEERDFTIYFAQLLAEGRAHLQANRPGSALAAYRQASHDPASRAVAFNGMAIAYDMIGRANLAEQYFIAAIELEPQNSAFAANLSRLNRNRATVPDEGVALAYTAAPGTVALAGEDTQPTDASGLMRRTSDREVRILAQGVEAETEARTDGDARPSIRVESRSAGRNRSPAAYPVRVAIPSEAETGGTTRIQIARRPQREVARTATSYGPRAQSYPIRVAINPATSADEAEQADTARQHNARRLTPGGNVGPRSLALPLRVAISRS